MGVTPSCRLGSVRDGCLECRSGDLVALTVTPRISMPAGRLGPRRVRGFCRADGDLPCPVSESTLDFATRIRHGCEADAQRDDLSQSRRSTGPPVEAGAPGNDFAAKSRRSHPWCSFAVVATKCAEPCPAGPASVGLAPGRLRGRGLRPRTVGAISPLANPAHPTTRFALSLRRHVCHASVASRK